ncbi:hypothetical protein HPB49_021775 [Dermacentor silvarum]|uniref:Uncharacterized protein n=1 Tax=Dermacentor silvarum TaxID=543639 RepID=A0ACB8D085_DERSI|nr:hypothetical protein HPB49_021775 [Dermacentor silvarum]
MTVTLVVEQNMAVQEDLSHMNNGEEESVLVKCRLFKRNDVTIINTYRTSKAAAYRKAWTSLLKNHNKENLLWVGDFNSHHEAWGYNHSTPQGRQLLQTGNDAHLTLLNDIETPNRIGNSLERYTNPNLTWGRTAKEVEWKCTGEALGRDHSVRDSHSHTKEAMHD